MLCFHQLFGTKKDRISHLRTVQNMNFQAISKYHLYINFLAQKKTVFPIYEKFKTRTFQYSVNIIFSSTFWLKNPRIFHLQKFLNKNFSVFSNYHLSINFLARKKTVFSISENFKTRTF